VCCVYVVWYCCACACYVSGELHVVLWRSAVRATPIKSTTQPSVSNCHLVNPVEFVSVVRGMLSFGALGEDGSTCCMVRRQMHSQPVPPLEIAECEVRLHVYMYMVPGTTNVCITVRASYSCTSASCCSLRTTGELSSRAKQTYLVPRSKVPNRFQTSPLRRFHRKKVPRFNGSFTLPSLFTRTGPSRSALTSPHKPEELGYRHGDERNGLDSHSPKVVCINPARLLTCLRAWVHCFLISCVCVWSINASKSHTEHTAKSQPANHAN
jgi:hypothetical protein